MSATKAETQVLLDACVHNAKKAQKNNFNVPEWLWPFIELANLSLRTERGVVVKREPFVYMKLVKAK